MSSHSDDSLNSLLLLRTTLYRDVSSDAIDSDTITDTLTAGFNVTVRNLDIDKMQTQDWDEVVDALVEHDKCIVL